MGDIERNMYLVMVCKVLAQVWITTILCAWKIWRWKKWKNPRKQGKSRVYFKIIIIVLLAPTEASNMSAVNASKPQRVITFVYMWFNTFVTCVGPCLYCLGVQACLQELYLIELSFSHLRRVGADSRLDLLMLIDFIGFYWSRLCWLTLINSIRGILFLFPYLM